MKISSLFKPLSFLPALALMYMIYSFSAQSGETSSSLSFKASRKIVQAVNVVTQQHWEDWEIDSHAGQIHSIVRKAAHVTEYYLLAIAVSFPLYVYGVRGILLMLLAGVICVGYACADEYHQSMVSGRAASARDVLIDSMGIFLGVILTRLIGWSGRMAITGPAYERRQKKKQQELDEREDELRRREEALRREEMRYRDARLRRPAQDPSGRASRPSQPVRRPSQPMQRPSQPGPQSWRPSQSEPQLSNPMQRPSLSEQQPVLSGSMQAADQAYSRDRQASDRELSGHTRVIGTRHEIDDRTRVYRSEQERRRMEQAYQRQVYERRQVQSEELREDSTSDQLSEDLPLSGLFRRNKQR